MLRDWITPEGAGGGYRLVRPPAEISVLDVVQALEGNKPLFQCNEIRSNCAVFGASLADLAARVASKAPKSFPREIEGWFATRKAGRSLATTGKRNPGVK